MFYTHVYSNSKTMFSLELFIEARVCECFYMYVNACMHILIYQRKYPRFLPYIQWIYLVLKRNAVIIGLICTSSCLIINYSCIDIHCNAVLALLNDGKLQRPRI